MNPERIQEFYEKRYSQKTFLEIANHERNENLYSDLLAFFLKPYEVHKLGTTVLKALIKAVPEINIDIESESYNSKSFYVSRELYTETNKRIDIFVCTEKYIIAIENKIFHKPNNDFKDYDNTLVTYAEGIGIDESNIIKIILSVKPVACPEGWKELRYKKLFEELGKIIEDLRSSRYFDYLQQLADSIRLLKESEVDQESVKNANGLFSENSIEYNELIDEFHFYKAKEIIPKLNALKKELGKGWKTWGENIKSSEGCSIYYKFKNHNIQVYAYIMPNIVNYEIEYHVGIQLDGKITSGKISLELLKIINNNQNELTDYNYSGNGRAGIYSTDYQNQTDVIKKLNWLKGLVEPKPS